MEKRKVLGTRVDLVTRKSAMDLIEGWINDSGYRNRLVMTAYSEFFVTARSDYDFRMALEGADLVTPDGIGPLAAIKYQESLGGHVPTWKKFLLGIITGWDILRGRVGEPVSGYWLFKKLVAEAAGKGWRVFLLGGFGETAQNLATKLQTTNHKLQIMADAGSQSAGETEGAEDERVIEKINGFKPDLLFVAYGPAKQEKWLAKHKKDLRVKVAMGVGGTFDEALGRVREAPAVMERYGLKWLWRLIQEPKRLGRIWNGVVVFPWLVFREGA